MKEVYVVIISTQAVDGYVICNKPGLCSADPATEIPIETVYGNKFTRDYEIQRPEETLVLVLDLHSQS